MFHELVNRNEDIRRLVEKGYAVAFDSCNYLIVRDIPYLDPERKLCWGAIVSKVVDAGQNRLVQDDHQVFFAGSVPHGLDGRPIPNLGGGPTTLAMGEASKDVVVERSFSNKPKDTGKFENFFDKVESYVRIISGPAIELHGANPLTFRMVDGGKSTSPFKVRDTLTSRAEISDLAMRFKDDVIAVVGLGGTGAYVLDFMVKTPVKEIRAFDPDLFFVHNSFRSPGKLDLDELGKAKAEVYRSRHESFREGLTVSRRFIDASCADDLTGVTFAFVCVDKGTSRAGIFDVLLAKRIPFIDVGMGLDRRCVALNGMLRTTYYSAENGPATRDKGLAELVDDPEGLYRTNIQIGELNALNACLAVVKFKQLRGFYAEEIPHSHALFRVGTLKVQGDAETRQD
jgi:hypothetical protein